jgi:hypothetical protein
VAFLTIITELPDITLVGKTRTWWSNSKWVKHAHKTVEIYNIVRIVRCVRHVRVLPRPLQDRAWQTWPGFQTYNLYIMFILETVKLFAGKD